MVHQTEIGDQNGSAETAPKALARDVGAFAHDVFSLAELQGELFLADIKECRDGVFLPGLVILGGATVGLACVPIGLVALAMWLSEAFGISNAAGFLISAVVGLVLSTVMCAVGMFQFRRSVAVLRRSQQELVRNLDWMKKVLGRSRSTRQKCTDNSWRSTR